MVSRLAVLVVTAVALVAACDPYIHDPNEFNRDAPGFGQEPKDRNSVDICYNKRYTTPQDILAVAEAECAKFNRTAVYRDTDILECPIATPARANFSCVPQ